jgi:hypothetical protein
VPELQTFCSHRKPFTFIYSLNSYYDGMSAAEVLKKFDELEVAMKTHLSKVDPPLVVDLILRQKREKKDPIYTLGFYKAKPKH